MQDPPFVSFSTVSRCLERAVPAAPKRSDVNPDRTSVAVDRKTVDLVLNVGAGQADVVQPEVVVAELRFASAVKSRPSSRVADVR
jgi:hypothetical protein